MALADEIRSAINSSKAIIGYRESIKFIKSNTPKSIVIANNIPDSVRKEIEEAARPSSVKVEVFDGDSVNLGVLCGKPFPISVIVIKL
jgi:large subunit ribosomal protein L30e